MILSVAYKINEALVNMYGDGEVRSAGILLIILSFLVIGGAFTWIGLQYYWFSGCWTNILIISITLFFALVFFVCLFLGTREDISLLTIGFVFLYTSYLSWSALSGRPTDSCNPYIHSAGTTLA
jgi:Serine incorporator (Serinc)